MSSFMKELKAIAAEVFPEAEDITLFPAPNRGFRMSWKTHDDPSRPSKRFQPIIIELDMDSFLDDQLPAHVSIELRAKFQAFMRSRRAAFIPRTTAGINEMHTEDRWIFLDGNS